MNERHIIHIHVDGRTILPGEAVLGVLFRLVRENLSVEFVSAMYLWKEADMYCSEF